MLYSLGKEVLKGMMLHNIRQFMSPNPLVEAFSHLVHAKRNTTMKKIDIGKAPEFTSPNPLTLVCSQKPDGTTNLAPVSFVTYLSFNPPMISFAMGKTAYTGERVRESGRVIITLPGSTLTDKVI